MPRYIDAGKWADEQGATAKFDRRSRSKYIGGMATRLWSLVHSGVLRLLRAIYTRASALFEQGATAKFDRRLFDLKYKDAFDSQGFVRCCNATSRVLVCLVR